MSQSKLSQESAMKRALDGRKKPVLTDKKSGCSSLQTVGKLDEASLELG
jgi:hypothetical protein